MKTKQNNILYHGGTGSRTDQVAHMLLANHYTGARNESTIITHLDENKEMFKKYFESFYVVSVLYRCLTEPSYSYVEGPCYLRLTY